MPEAPMPVTTLFPGFTLSRNSPHPDAVRMIQRALNARGCGPVPVDGMFSAAVESAVRTFQARFVDLEGLPMKIDGEVGPVTWGALFGAASSPAMRAGTSLAAAALGVARTQIGVMEKPPGSNRGPEVEQYLRSVGLGGGNAWCAAFVHWCVDQAVKGPPAGPNPLPKTGGVMELWRRSRKAGLPVVLAADATKNPALVTAGMIFIIDHGGGHGHTGFVAGFTGGRLATVEGNSNDQGSAEGTGVFALTRRTIGTINAGFIGLP